MTDPDYVGELGHTIRESMLFDEDAPPPTSEIGELAVKLLDLFSEIACVLPEPTPGEPELVARLRFCLDWAGIY